MKTIEMEANVLLTGVGIVPIPETTLQGLLENEHVVLHEEAENDELEEDFMRRVFDKALRIPNFIKSTRQCLIIHIPGGHEIRSIGGTELLDSYVNKWMVGNAGYQMHWGLYEIPGASRMQITIVANVSAPTKEETETLVGDTKGKASKNRRKMVVMGMTAVTGVFSKGS